MFRINLSHTEVKDLEKIINFIRHHSSVPICIDTEGAQIRTRINKQINLKTFQRGVKFLLIMKKIKIN